MPFSLCFSRCHVASFDDIFFSCARSGVCVFFFLPLGCSFSYRLFVLPSCLSLASPAAFGREDLLF